jgi:PEP-CTERM motif
LLQSLLALPDILCPRPKSLISYQQNFVSETPLPAALPLFGTGLFGLIGWRRKGALSE